MNVVLIMTDTQNCSMIGAYNPQVATTPNLDRLADEGTLFTNAYTTCPVCTPARGAIFSGLHPQVNGAICNNVSPYSHVPLLGTILCKNGYRAGYTGKWHLDGTAYFGDGIPGGGFEPDWWYDGKRYAEEIGPELFAVYRNAKTPEELRDSGFQESVIWGHRVADHAIDFLENVGSDPFFLVCSFDEPHQPYVAPPEYWEDIDQDAVQKPGNFNAPIEGKPQLARIHRRENGETTWNEYSSDPDVLHWYACNAYVDKEIGRVVDVISKLHDDDTIIIYTADHGDQHRAHGLTSKGPMMYEESTNIPFIVRLPSQQVGTRGFVNHHVVSHIDILPTILDYCQIEIPESVHGVSLRPTLEDTQQAPRSTALLNFHRFAINHDSFGSFYPIRAATNGHFKLVINLNDQDEFYDLQSDPYEMRNLIHEPGIGMERDTLHDWILCEMDRIRDPYRSWIWANRPWRSAREPFYRGGVNRPKPQGFSFEVEATGA